MKKSFTQFIGGSNCRLASILLFFIALVPIKSWAEEYIYNGESGVEIRYITDGDEVILIGMQEFPSDGKLVIPGEIDGKTVTQIRNNAFLASPITSVEIPASVKAIGSEAFSESYDLSQVSFAEGSQLTTIGDQAFSETKIKEITIPEKVTYIGTNAFGGGDDAISTITFLSKTPCAIMYNSFCESVPADFTIIVPAGCAEAYKNGWTLFADYIKEAEPSAIKGIIAPAGTSSAHAAIYTLDGKLASKDGNTQALAKGIYVQNGKKMVIGK